MVSKKQTEAMTATTNSQEKRESDLQSCHMLKVQFLNTKCRDIQRKSKERTMCRKEKQPTETAPEEVDFGLLTKTVSQLL